jgi:hypothetical protein
MDFSKSATVKIQGGLGNQLFQYSFAIFLKKHLKTNINLDISWFDKQDLRKFQLNDFLTGPLFDTIKLESNIYNKILSYRSEKFISFLLKKNFFTPINYFDGYWQDIFYAQYLTSEQYFKKNIFLKKFTKDYYVIHLRRGDFLSSKVHYILSDEHYLKHIQLFNDKIIYILSSNKEDALNFMKKTKANVEFIDCDDMEAFALICNASGGIASNSTFCWWAIFLSDCRNWLFPYRWLKKKNIIDHNLNIKNTILI